MASSKRNGRASWDPLTIIGRRPRAASSGVRRALGAAAAVLAMSSCFAGAATAQDRSGVREAEMTEIAPFRLLSIEGYVGGRYWRDHDESVVLKGPAASGETLQTRQTLTSFGGTAFVMTHSYIYHPNFLLLDVGAGPVYFRESYELDGVDSRSHRSTYDLAARATFLRDKPYRGGLFYERKSDSYPVGPSQSLLTENTRYGFDFSLLKPVTTVPIKVDASRFRSKGRGSDQVIDDSIDEANFRAERAWGRLGDTMFRYQAMQTDSESGSVGLPIERTRSRTHRADVDTYLNFGGHKQYDLVNTVSFNTIDYTGTRGALSDNQAFRFDLNFRARPTDALQTRTRYQFDAYEQKAGREQQSGRLNAFSAGATYKPASNFSASLDALASFNRNSAFAADLVGSNGSLNYRYELPFGEIAANYGVSWNKREQTAREPTAQAVGERITLTGITWVTLNHPLVVPGSIVVSNTQRTQIFVEGRDYFLSVLGLSTRIQRTIDGAIVDGQEVLVDYAYDTGGTYGLTQLDNSIDLSWRLKQYFSIYVRYLDASPHLDYGAPTAPLNPATTTRYGARADLPFELLGQFMQLGALAEREDRREVISPYERSLFETYFETSLPLIARGGMRFGTARQKTEYDLTPEDDVTQQTLNVRLWTRFRGGLSVELQGLRVRDSGSLRVERQYKQAMAKATWRIRQVLLTLDVSWTNEMRGQVERTHSTGRFALRRDF